MNSFHCDDCQHSFYVPGSNLPLVIQGGCPECGGDARPEPDQPSPTRPDGDGRVRNLVDPDTGDDTGGNPLQEGILADGGWQNRRVRDESFASVRVARDWDGDTEETWQWINSDEYLYNAVRNHVERSPHSDGIKELVVDALTGNDSARIDFDNVDWDAIYETFEEDIADAEESAAREEANPSPTFREVKEPHLTPEESPWAWQPGDVIEDRRGGRLHVQQPAGQPDDDSFKATHIAPEQYYHGQSCNLHPRALIDTYGYKRVGNQPLDHNWLADPKLDQPGDTTFPADWGKASSRRGSRREYVTPMRNHPEASNQTPSLPWQFEVDEVAEPGMDNEDAEEKINGQEKKAGPELLALAPMALEAVGLGAGEAAGVAGGAGAAGGLGGMPGMSLLQRAVPSLLGNAIGGGLGGGGNASTPPQAPVEARPMEMISADKPGGGTPDEFPKDTEDPEKVDPKEHNDGDTKEWQNDVSVNGMGGTDSPHGGDGTPTPGLEALQMLLPLVVHYAESPDSAMDHPLLGPLHKLLGDEGHLDGPEDPDAVMQIIRLVKGEPDEDATSLPKAEDQEDAEQSDDGKDKDVGDRTHEAASHQGPHSPEQIAAVQQLLMDQGRTEEVPNVPMQPWEYADELAQVAHKPDQPPQDTGAQPQPMQDPAPPENTMPMPGMEAPPPGEFGPATASRTSNPEYINVEPNWDGMRRWLLNIARSDIETALKVNKEMGSEGLPEEQLLSAHGDQHIPTEQMDWNDPRNSAHDHTNPNGAQGVPAADQLQQQDPEGDTDSSNAWQTGEGQPLIVGEQYELQTPGVEIPDIVRVKAVRPESVTLEFTGAYELGFSKDITRQEFNVMGYQFAHVRGDEPEAQASEDANNAPDNGNIPDFSGPGSGAGGSDHQVMTNWHVKSFMPGAPGGTQPGGQCPQCAGPLQPDGSCAGCERSSLAPGAPGVPAAPAGIQNPNGGPPTTPAPAPMTPGGTNPSRPPQSRPPAYSSVPTHDPETGLLLDTEAQATIARLLRNAAIESSPSSAEGEAHVALAGADARDWLTDGAGDKTAGAHYSPSDQRALIDEDGVARNADKLDLSHTHYEARRHTTADDFMFGL